MSITFDPSPAPRPPRPAATVVLLRAREGGAPQVFMLRRSAKSPFMPDALVFPGGAVDPRTGRRAATRRTRRRPGASASRRRGSISGRGRCTGSTRGSRRRPSRGATRRASSWPTSAAEEGGDAAADGHETLDGRWATRGGVPRAGGGGTVDLPPPTLCTLLRLADERAAGLRSLTAEEARAPVLPKAMLEAGPDGSGRIAVVLPHAPDYEDLPGEGAPAPTRSLDLPARIVREGAGWRPA
jgi:hypothetical protein